MFAKEQWCCLSKDVSRILLSALFKETQCWWKIVWSPWNQQKIDKGKEIDKGKLHNYIECCYQWNATEPKTVQYNSVKLVWFFSKGEIGIIDKLETELYSNLGSQ